MKKYINQIVTLSAVIAVLLSALGVTHGDAFGTGDNAFEIEFVTVGAPGNAPDTTGVPNPAGAVSDVFRMAKYATSTDIVRKANEAGSLGITFDDRDGDQPATTVSWFEAAIFTNWLNTSSGYDPAYKFSEGGQFQLWQQGDAGYDPSNPYRSTLAHYFLPSTDEYYKAAFYDPAADVYYDYPTGSNSEPIPVASGTLDGTAVYLQTEDDTEPAPATLAGGLSPFGTMGQGGNTWEWHESEVVQPNDNPSDIEGRVVRGGSWRGAVDALGKDSINPNNPGPIREFNDLTFRVASVPEPQTLITLLILGLPAILGARARARSRR